MNTGDKISPVPQCYRNLYILEGYQVGNISTLFQQPGLTVRRKNGKWPVAKFGSG